MVAPAMAAGDRPNIVVILSDDQGYNALGYTGGFVKTPNIDRIAHQGVQLDRFYVSPMCSPTRAGIMTGRYPMRYGMARSVVRPWAEFGLPPEELTLPESLADAGYRHRGAFGKWHLGHLSPEWHPLSQGFTRYVGMYNGAGNYFDRERNGEIDWHRDTTDIQPDGYTTNLITDAAVEFITASADEAPFFCYVPFSAPHDPFQAPQEYIDQYKQFAKPDGKPSDKQIYCAMIACMDDGVGRIFKALEDAGVAENTIIWFHSDNGGVPRIEGNNDPRRAGKLTVYEGGIHAPSAVWWPGKIEGGRKIDAPIVNIDLMPTLLSLLGVEANGGKPLDGVDVSTVLTGKETTLPPRDIYAFNGQQGIEEEQNAVIDPDGWKLVVVGPDVRRDGPMTDKHTVELFNLKTDPSEKDNVAEAHPEIVKRLAAKLVEFRESEPKNSLPPINRPPRGFEPPENWHNDSVASKQ